MRLLYIIFVAPITWMLRMMAWVLFMPLGAYLSYRKGRSKRHRQLVHAASRQNVVYLPQPQPNFPTYPPPPAPGPHNVRGVS